MGVLEFFGTLIKNEVTATSIKSNFKDRTDANHLLIDFNSIIHVSSQKVLDDVNTFLQLVLKTIYERHALTGAFVADKFEKYKMAHIQKNINQNTDPNTLVDMFHEHFTEKYLDKLIITLVINTVLHLIRTYCQNKLIKTLLLAIDGVPSKGKMIEQKQRRYMGAVVSAYEKKILDQYRDYLLEQPDYIYLSTKENIKWSRNKITPGTAFMHKLVSYLKSETIQEKFKINRPKLEVIVSDMYEIGEGEKKIVNYVNKYLANTTDMVMIYSPDADMILMSIILPIDKMVVLRHNQQTSIQSKTNIYDLIDIRMLKSNIAYYINNNPLYPKADFDINRINYDLVCMSTLFGNDFVPKMETLNVKKGFQNIMDAYLKTLIQLKDKGYYLVKNNQNYRLNFTFLKHILRHLLPEENDFIKHNDLYAEYITLGQIKYVFSDIEINDENLIPVYQQFRKEYENLKHTIKQKGNLFYFEKHDQFMISLKKALQVIMNDNVVNTTYLTNRELIRLLQTYYQKYRDFPRLNINLNTYSRHLDDPHHRKNIKDKHYNNFQKEIYRFRNMLDQYYIKFNAQPLSLSSNKINEYYLDYFGVELYKANTRLSQDAKQVMHDYLEGLLWVFHYYFNDPSYINRWYYVHERAPLIQHLLIFLESINLEYFNQMFNKLDQYQVEKLENYFNPIEQLIYVSPMVPEVLQLLPSNYRQYILSDDLDPFLRNYFVDIKEIVRRLWKETVSRDVDCRGIIFFNKCLIKSLTKPTTKDDKHFLQAIQKVKPTAISHCLSQNKKPKF